VSATEPNINALAL